MTHSTTPNPQPTEEQELPDLGTYAGYVKAVHDFAVRLAERSSFMDKYVAELSMTPTTKAATIAMMIESFVNVVVQTRLKVYKADQRAYTAKQVRQTNISQIENWRDYIKPRKDLAWLVKEMDEAIVLLKDEEATDENGVYRLATLTPTKQDKENV